MTDVIYGNQAVFIGDSLAFEDENNQKYIFEPMELSYGIQNHLFYSLSDSLIDVVYHNFPYTFIGGKSIFHLTSKQKYKEEVNFPMEIDYLWIHDMYSIRSVSILDRMRPKTVIIGAKTSKQVREYLSNYVKGKEIVLYILHKQGAMHIDY